MISIETNLARAELKCNAQSPAIDLIGPANISAQDIANTAVGNVILGWFEFNQYVFNCIGFNSSALGPSLLTPANARDVNGAKVYNTNINGIGIVVTAADPARNLWFNLNSNKQEILTRGGWAGIGIYVNAAFVKTAEVVDSGVIDVTAARFWTEDNNLPGNKVTSNIMPPIRFRGTTVAGRGTTCDYSNNTSAAAYRFSAPTLIPVDGNTQPGTVLWTSPPVLGDRVTQLQCGQGGLGGLESYWSSTSFDSGGYQVQPTNIPGIGYSISYTGFPSGIRGYPNNGDGINPGNNNNSFQATLRFVRTSGTMSAGLTSLTNTFNGTSSFTTWYVGANKARFANFYVNDASFNISRPSGTCNMSNYTLKLRPNNLTEIASVGSRTAATRFDVYADCPNIASTPIYFTVNDIKKAGAACDRTLNNIAKNGATGVGMYLSWDNSNTSNHCFGQEERMADINLSGTSNTRVKIGLDLGLIRLAQEATPGPVEGKVIITVKYR